MTGTSLSPQAADGQSVEVGSAIQSSSGSGSSGDLSGSVEPYCSSSPQATLTDLYQVTMLYAHWKSGRQALECVFDAYFRKCPFGGEFAVCAGINEVVRFVNCFRFTPSQVEYLKTVLPDAEEAFFDFLLRIDGSQICIDGIKEGTLVFPNTPLVRVSGPLGVCQLLETAILNLVNFPTLIATNAARFRLAAGWDKELLEFGTRRAQGPDGAMTASKYSYLGGFDGTSSVQAGHLFKIPVRGTHSHSFVTSFNGLEDLPTRSLSVTLYHDGDSTAAPRRTTCPNFVDIVMDFRQEILGKLWPNLGYSCRLYDRELAAFIAFAQAFPHSFLALVDTFDVLASGIPNFLAVSLALNKVGIRPVGIRLDSGDLAYLSQKARQMFAEASDEFGCDFRSLKIAASNDINESVLRALNEQNHQIDTFGIGTNLVTCQAQPALGLVYKLAEIEGRPCMKLSQDVDKASIPGYKMLYRLYSRIDEPLVDIMMGCDETAPCSGERVLCCHLFDRNKRCLVVPSRVESLLVRVWDRGHCCLAESLQSARTRCRAQLLSFRKDILRPVNPAPYKISVTQKFYNQFHDLWSATTPIPTIL